jgi:hypothetical protein
MPERQSCVDQAEQGRRERSVLCTRATEDAATRSVHAALMLNPLRTEGEAFRVLLYVLAVIVAAIVIVLAARAIF